MAAQERVVVVGGAIVGSCIAYFLRELRFPGPVIVLERDPTYQKSSTALSAASIRTQFGCEVNVQMSLFGAHFLRDAKARFGMHTDVGFRERGYLILGDAGTATARKLAAAKQNASGASIQILDAAALTEKFPWLNTDDITMATYGSRDEGWFDAWALLQTVRDAARTRGVEYRRAHVTELHLRAGRICSASTLDGDSVDGDWFIDAGGAGSAEIVRSLQVNLPVSPRKRTVFRLKAPLDDRDFPMLFDLSGAWIRPEGDGYIAGVGLPDDKDPDATGDYEPDWSLFEDTIWPTLAHRVPQFERLRVESAWAGHYEVNVNDHNGIIGPHDEIPNLLFATGFSGHGVMHAPATGRALAEHVLHGAYQTLDVASLGYHRIRSGIPLLETIVY